LIVQSRDDRTNCSPWRREHVMLRPAVSRFTGTFRNRKNSNCVYALHRCIACGLM
jgi:hypothetical protein